MRANMKKYKLLLLFSILLSSLGIFSSSLVYASGPNDDNIGTGTEIEIETSTACSADQFLHKADETEECLTKQDCMDKSGVNPIKAPTEGQAGTCASCPLDKEYNATSMMCDEIVITTEEEKKVATMEDIKKAVRSEWSKMIGTNSTNLVITTAMTEAVDSDPAKFIATLTVKPDLWKLLRSYVTLGEEFDFDGTMKTIPSLELPTIKEEVAKEIFVIFGELIDETAPSTDPLLKKISDDILGAIPTSIPTATIDGDKLLKYILFKEKDSVSIGGTSIAKPTEPSGYKEYFKKVIVPEKVEFGSSLSDFPADENANVVVTITYKVEQEVIIQKVDLTPSTMNAIPALTSVELANATADITYSDWATLKAANATMCVDVSTPEKGTSDAGLPSVMIAMTGYEEISAPKLGFVAFSLEVETCMPDATNLETVLPKYAELSTADKVKYEMALIKRENAFAEKIMMNLTKGSTEGIIPDLTDASGKLEGILKAAIDISIDANLGMLINHSGTNLADTEYSGNYSSLLKHLLFAVKKVRLTTDDIKTRLEARGILSAEADIEKTKFSNDMLGYRYVIVGMRNLDVSVINLAYNTHKDGLKIMTTIPAELKSAAGPGAYIETPATSQNGYTFSYLPDTNIANATYDLNEAKASNLSTFSEAILKKGFSGTLAAHAFHVMSLGNILNPVLKGASNTSNLSYRGLLLEPHTLTVDTISTDEKAQIYMRFIKYGAQLSKAMETGGLLEGMEMIATDDKYMTGLDGSKKFHLIHLAESVKMLNHGFDLHSLDLATVVLLTGSITSGQKVFKIVRTATTSPKGIVLLLGYVVP